jgi:hypothetical protein
VMLAEILAGFGAGEEQLVWLARRGARTELDPMQ